MTHAMWLPALAVVLLGVSAAPAAAGPFAYVTASQLKLRETPSPEGKVLLRLRINTKVRLMSADASSGGWSAIELANGRKGFVAADMLAAQQLTAVRALDEAKSSNDPAGKLAWLERAAALAPNPETLIALAAAVRAGGDEKRARLLESRLPWPDDVYVSPDFHHEAALSDVRVEWRGPNPAGMPEQPAQLTPAQLKEIGIDPRAMWWVLPARGAAVKARFRSAVYKLLNDCGGTWGVWLTLDVKLPEGEFPVAATARSTPPAGWEKPMLAVDLAAAKKVALAQLKELKVPGAAANLQVAASQDGVVIARAWWLPPGEVNKDWFEQHTEVIDLRIEAGKVTMTKRTKAGGMTPAMPKVRRDLDGDGLPELLVDDTCAGRVLDGALGAELDGVNAPMRTETINRCCGC